jgi:hypothetical protein
LGVQLILIDGLDNLRRGMLHRAPTLAYNPKPNAWPPIMNNLSRTCTGFCSCDTSSRLMQVAIQFVRSAYCAGRHYDQLAIADLQRHHKVHRRVIYKYIG